MVEEIVLKCAMAKEFLYKPVLANKMLWKYGSAGEIMKNAGEEQEDIRRMLVNAFDKITEVRLVQL